jgi:hypothetical protein
MLMRFRAQQFGWLFRLVKILFASALFITSITPSWASAQSTDDPWAAPLNLSHSGVAVNPAIVTDSEGVVHVVWQDDLENFVYTRFDGSQWSTPETTDLNRLFNLPIPSDTPSRNQTTVYTGPNPVFVAGPGQFVFAFWISPQAKLLTSRVRNLDFGHLAGWDSGRVITPQAASFAITVDVRGEWHLAYLRTVGDRQNPAGIYYTRSKNGGSSWAQPKLLYESLYLRRLGEGEANLSIATAGTEEALSVYLAWDNRPRKQVLLAQSVDGGDNWEEPTLIAGPTQGSGSAGPFNIHVGAKQDSLVLVWQDGQPEGACSQNFQSSNDGGTTWSDPQPMIEDLLGCEQSNGFVKGFPTSPESPLYFLTNTKGQVFLTAWNGLQWSQPQAQSILTSFEEPEIYTEVLFGCQRATLSGEQLYVVGCDEAGGGDVWVNSRDLETDLSWFKPPVWSQLSPISSDSLEMESVELVTTDDGFIHAFFNQYQDSAIYYTYWNGELWSHITPVLKLPDGNAGSPAIATGPGNELFLVTPNDRGAVYFSRATSGDASSESRWSTPTKIEMGHDGEIGSVDVAWDAAGMINVAYSVPVNEERGIYLVQSKDNGTSWSKPLQVFNGAAAGFELVGAPSLLTSENGFLHMIWKQQSIQEDGVPQSLSLFYARSEDGGRTFSDAEPAVKEPVAWREIVTDGKGNLHLFWQPQNTLTTVWDQVSMDGGRTWQFPQGLPGEGMTAAIMEDSVGRLHLVDAGPGSLGHWLWDGDRWESEAPLHWSLASQQENTVELLAAAVNKQGKMVVVLAVPAGDGDSVEKNVLYSTRSVELPPKQTSIKNVLTQTLMTPTSIPVTPTPVRSPTPVSTVDSEQTNSQVQIDPSETNSRISPFTMAILPVALLLLSVLGFVIRQAVRAKDR